MHVWVAEIKDLLADKANIERWNVLMFLNYPNSIQCISYQTEYCEMINLCVDDVKEISTKNIIVDPMFRQTAWN